MGALLKQFKNLADWSYAISNELNVFNNIAKKTFGSEVVKCMMQKKPGQQKESLNVTISNREVCFLLIEKMEKFLDNFEKHFLDYEEKDIIFTHKKMKGNILMHLKHILNQRKVVEVDQSRSVAEGVTGLSNDGTEWMNLSDDVEEGINFSQEGVEKKKKMEEVRVPLSDGSRMQVLFEQELTDPIYECLQFFYQTVEGCTTNKELFSAVMVMCKRVYQQIGVLLHVAELGYSAEKAGSMFKEGMTKDQKFALHYFVSIFWMKVWRSFDINMGSDYIHILVFISCLFPSINYFPSLSWFFIFL